MRLSSSKGRLAFPESISLEAVRSEALRVCAVAAWATVIALLALASAHADEVAKTWSSVPVAGAAKTADGITSAWFDSNKATLIPAHAAELINATVGHCYGLDSTGETSLHACEAGAETPNFPEAADCVLIHVVKWADVSGVERRQEVAAQNWYLWDGAHLQPGLGLAGKQRVVLLYVQLNRAAANAPMEYTVRTISAMEKNGSKATDEAHPQEAAVETQEANTEFAITAPVVSASDAAAAPFVWAAHGFMIDPKANSVVVLPESHVDDETVISLGVQRFGAGFGTNFGSGSGAGSGTTPGGRTASLEAIGADLTRIPAELLASGSARLFSTAAFTGDFLHNGVSWVDGSLKAVGAKMWMTMLTPTSILKAGDGRSTQTARASWITAGGGPSYAKLYGGVVLDDMYVPNSGNLNLDDRFGYGVGGGVNLTIGK